MCIPILDPKVPIGPGSASCASSCGGIHSKEDAIDCSGFVMTIGEPQCPRLHVRDGHPSQLHILHVMRSLGLWARTSGDLCLAVLFA